jgi:hypothetical protein
MILAAALPIRELRPSTRSREASPSPARSRRPAAHFLDRRQRALRPGDRREQFRAQRADATTDGSALQITADDSGSNTARAFVAASW